MKTLENRKKPTLISIVAPVFNEEDGLLEFTRRCYEVMNKHDFNFEIIFVNDGSRDNSLEVLHVLHHRHKNISIVNFTRNFGKEVALTAGITYAKGDAIVIIDTDLQDPPELIPAFVAGWMEGYDSVYGKRISRKSESWLKLFTAKMFYRVAERLGSVSIPRDVGDFRLISRRFADDLLKIPEYHRFMKGLYAWVGYRQKAIEYERDPRYAGNTKWNYWKLWNFALEGITSFTVGPLKLSTYVGIAVALVAFIYGGYIMAKTVIWGDPVRGYPTIVVLMLFLGGVQLFFLGIIGEYIGRIFNETKRRPLYLIESVTESDIASLDTERKNVK